MRAIIDLVAGVAISKVVGIFDGARVHTAQLFVNTSVRTPLTTYKVHLSDLLNRRSRTQNRVLNRKAGEIGK